MSAYKNNSVCIHFFNFIDKNNTAYEKSNDGEERAFGQ